MRAVPRSDSTMIFGLVALVITSACGGSSTSPSAPFASAKILPGPASMVSDAVGSAPATTLTELFIKRGTCGVPFSGTCKLMGAGRPITWGDWTAIEGAVFFRCDSQRTEVLLFAGKLVPNGPYTVWLNGVPIGTADGAQNSFRAASNGEGRLETTVGPPCVASGGSMLLAYHNDGQTHGSVPGPPETWAAQGQLIVP